MILQVLVFNRNGNFKAEIQPAINYVTWRLNELNQAEFTLPISDSKCTPDNLAYGNLVLIRFANPDIPDFGGVIDPPRRVNGTDSVTVSAYGGEKIFAWRCTPMKLNYDGASPGSIYRDLIYGINADEPTRLTPNIIYLGGGAMTKEYHLDNIWTAVRGLATESGEDFSVIPFYSAFSGGVMSLQCNWYESRGMDVSGTHVLGRGAHFSDFLFDDQGDIYNSVTMVGPGSTWDAGSRIHSKEEDTNSINLYGLRTSGSVEPSILTESALDVAALARLNDIKVARSRLTLTGVTRHDFDIGDIVRVEGGKGYWSVRDSWRVLARQWQNNSIRLELQKVV